MLTQLIRFFSLQLWFGILLASASVWAAPRELLVPGNTIFEHALPAEKVVIEIQTRPRERLTDTELDIYMNSPSIHYGLSDPDEAVVHRIKVTWGSLPPVYLTSSAFSDLHDPRQAEVQSKGENLLLLITGGSTAGSYRAQIEIAAHGLVRRWVYNVKLGHEQITTYSYPAAYVESVNNELKRKQLKEKQPPKRP